jgi:hypothetical protein
MSSRFENWPWNGIDQDRLVRDKLTRNLELSQGSARCDAGFQNSLRLDIHSRGQERQIVVGDVRPNVMSITCTLIDTLAAHGVGIDMFRVGQYSGVPGQPG